MNITQPTQNNLNTFQQVLRWAQSVFKALNAGLTFSSPKTQDANGVWNTFVQDNFNGVILYVGAAGSGAPVAWVTSNAGKSINHGLHRQPVGFIPIYKTKTCDVYSTATPSANLITLACTDASAQVTLFIF